MEVLRNFGLHYVSLLAKAAFQLSRTSLVSSIEPWRVCQTTGIKTPPSKESVLGRPSRRGNAVQRLLPRAKPAQVEDSGAVAVTFDHGAVGVPLGRSLWRVFQGSVRSRDQIRNDFCWDTL